MRIIGLYKFAVTIIQKNYTNVEKKPPSLFFSRKFQSTFFKRIVFKIVFITN